MNCSNLLMRSLSLAATLVSTMVVLLCGFVTPASASLVLSVGPAFTSIAQPAVGATQEITMTVFLRAQAGTEDVVGYSLPVDLSPPAGKGLPLGMTITGATARTIFGGPQFKFNLNPGEGDLLATAGFPGEPAVPFDTNFKPLFDFNILVDDTVATGDYSLDFVQGVLLSLDPNLTASFSAPAIIRVVAVPEPSVLGILGLLAVPYVLRRQRLSQVR